MIVDAKSAFGIVADGSDETAKINNAIASVIGQDAGETLYFGGGIYGVDGLDAIPTTFTPLGAGPYKTTFKNRSATARMFELKAPVAGSGNFGSAFSKFSGIGIDQNGCSGSAIEINTMYCALDWLWIRNQGGGRTGSAAVKVRNGTHFDMQRVGITNSDNCIDVENTYYMSGRNISLERQKGRALRAKGLAQTMIDHLYTDNGNPSSVGSVVPEVMLVEDCSTFLVNGFSQELASAGSLEASISVPGEMIKAFNVFRNTMNVGITGGRVYHTSNDGSAYINWFDGCGVTADMWNWYETKANMILFGASAGNKRLSIRGVDTYNTGSGSKYGAAAWYGKMNGKVSIEDWKDQAGASTICVNAKSIYARSVTASIDVAHYDNGKRIFIDCDTVGGGGLNTPIAAVIL